MIDTIDNAPVRYANQESDRLRAALETSPGFRLIHSRLLHLLDEDAEEDNQVMPTGYAYHTALALLLEANLQINTMPRASVTADETGGVRVQWISPERQVRLVIPAESAARHYLYFETKQAYDLEDNLTPASLAQRLNWFNDQAL